jgi:hypothetical protein
MASAGHFFVGVQKNENKLISEGMLSSLLTSHSPWVPDNSGIELSRTSKSVFAARTA